MYMRVHTESERVRFVMLSSYIILKKVSVVTSKNGSLDY